ncbi:hypothetical protein CGCSCA4_v003228 [Colletotrichum siamense]|uniref:PPPDE domain-containing protein n=1 Tax=Colletotrichum siamense TaxID=690259 RepID=A0A9P5K4H3_COLSI|nr:hypothetical protein CGCSCA4_v003228 [Colletotrichum siamense]KAF4859428.1 hypothetical protein CGCSCA2_v006387 [Colletotrichum siamense]
MSNPTAIRNATLIIGVITGWLSLLIYVCNVHRSRKARKAVAELDLTDLSRYDFPSSSDPKKTFKTIQKKWQEHLKTKAASRQEEEKSTAHGEPVWLSLWAFRGELRHWQLLSHCYKYELRRKQRPKPAPEESDGSLDSSADEQTTEAEGVVEPIDDVTNTSGFGRFYEAATRQYPNYASDMEQRDRAIATRGRPDVQIKGGLVSIVLIGWTDKTKDQVDEAFWQVEKNFGDYHLLNNNCQHFVRNLADLIVSKKSQDWNWFRKMSLKSYGEYVGPQTLGTPGGLARLLLVKLTALRASKTMTDPMALRVLDGHISALNSYLLSLHVELSNVCIACAWRGGQVVAADQAVMLV